MKIRMASAKDAVSPTSTTQLGTGRIIMTMTAISARLTITVGL